jgi:type III pantothenate kinase
MKLLVDIGNTRLKWATWAGRALGGQGAHAHGAEDNVDFVSLFKDIPKVDAAWIASVASPVLDMALAQALRARFGIEPVFVRSSATACGVHSAYAQPERLGVDRFLGLIAVHAQAQGPAVIASCGTALTLDALAVDGTHLGGLIAPSPELMRGALLGNTARLGDVAQASIVEIADNTADAVASGSWLAATALVERFFAHAVARFGVAPMLVLGGGGAAQLGALLALPHRIDAELVLRGLACYADQAPAAAAVG